MVRANTKQLSTANYGIPTAGISCLVKTFVAKVRNRIRLTPSSNAWYIAIRPCIAVTDASGNRPVQSS